MKKRSLIDGLLFLCSYVHTILKKLRSSYCWLLDLNKKSLVFGLKFCDDLIQRHCWAQNPDGSYNVKNLPSMTITGMCEGQAFITKMWTKAIPAWVLKKTLNVKVSATQRTN